MLLLIVLMLAMFLIGGHINFLMIRRVLKLKGFDLVAMTKKPTLPDRLMIRNYMELGLKPGETVDTPFGAAIPIAGVGEGGILLKCVVIGGQIIPYPYGEGLGVGATWEEFVVYFPHYKNRVFDLWCSEQPKHD